MDYEVGMEFSNEQKLIITLLTDIHAALKIKDSGLDPVFVQRMVASDNGWALAWQYPGIYEHAPETPEKVKFVADVLDMWEAIEHHYQNLDAAERQQLVGLAPVFGNSPAFRGFDGNNEAEERSIVDILVEDLGRWEIFKGRDTNSHVSLSDAYIRMREAFEEIIGTGFEFDPCVEEFAALLNEQTHPDNR